MKYEEIDIDLIEEPKTDVREEIDNIGLEELATSIQQTGLIQPIVVFPNQGKYEIAVGHRRFLAFKIARLKKIPAIIKEIKPEELEVMKLDENIFREDVSAVQIAKYIYKIMGSRGLTVMEVARYLGKTPQWVNSMIRLLDVDEYTQKAVDEGELSYSAALELTKVEDENYRDVLTRAAVQGGAHTRVIKDWVQDYKQVKRHIEEDKSNELPAEEGETERTHNMHCKLCGHQYPAEQLINIQIDPKCYGIFQEMSKNVREELERPEE